MNKNLLTPSNAAKRYPGDQLSLKWQAKYMILWDVPDQINKDIPALPNKIFCNKDIVAPLEKAFRNLIKTGAAKELITWDGCFNVRKTREAESMSLHSFGVAIDLNAAWNQLKKEPHLSTLFVWCFTDAGFNWGGFFKRLDGMHFELADV